MTGMNQIGDIMWGRIESLYNAQRLKGTPSRTSEKLHCHWSRVVKEVKVFEAYHHKAEKNGGSGKFGKDQLVDVPVAYQDVHE